MKKFFALIAAILIFTVCNYAFAETTHSEALNQAKNSIKTASKEIVKSTYYPSYHFAAPANWLSDPNGLVYYKGAYHLFYQHNPYAPKNDKMHWGHAVSADMINWIDKPIALAPSETYDKDGVFSGTAIAEDDILYLLYTGQNVTVNNEKTDILQTQNLAMSKDGINFGKSANNPVIKMPPHYSFLTFSSKDFTDPFVWKQSDRYYALVGTRYEKTNDGAVLLFKSKDLRNWVFINITAIGSKGEMGHMWECPGLVHIENNDVLMICPQGIKPHGKMFLNKYQSGWFVGKLDYDTGKFKQKGPFGLFDHGFDFYAPQVIETPDGRNVVIGWLGMPETQTPEQADKWAGMMSVPREMKIVDNRVVTVPVSELKTLRDDSVSYKNQIVGSEKVFNNVKGEVYELCINADLTKTQNFAIKLRTSASQETVLSYDKNTNLLKLNRDKSGHALNGEREVALPLTNNLLKLQIFVDKSSVEVFANDGQAVMSSRIYPDKNAVGIKFVSQGETKINSLDFYKLKSIHY